MGAAVSPDVGAARQAALDGASLDADRLDVEMGGRGEVGSEVTVVVRYSSPTAVPVVGALVGDVHLSASATMRIET